MYPVDVHNPMYYRSHPFKNQMDLPTSAFKNRQPQEFYSEIPTGKAYFDQTNKKHFSNMFNRSQIQEDNVLKEDYPQEEVQKSRIAMDKSYFRSLNVDDIQGAKPNTLISKAVKNREKALTKLKKQQQQQEIHTKMRENTQKGYQLPGSTKNQKVYKQQEAINKFSKNKSIMENNSLRILNNNHFATHSLQANLPNQKESFSGAQKNYHFRAPKPQPLLNRHHDRSQESMMQKELLQKELKIKELERQLGLKYESSLSNGQMKYPNNPQQVESASPYNLRYPSGKSSSQHAPSNQYENPFKSQTQAINTLIKNEPANYSDQYSKIPSHNPQYNSISHDPRQQQIILGPSTHAERSVPQNQYYSRPTTIVQSRQKSFTQKVEKSPNLNIDKTNIRKYNPTFLSFESDRVKDSIGIRAQNVIY